MIVAATAACSRERCTARQRVLRLLAHAGHGGRPRTAGIRGTGDPGHGRQKGGRTALRERRATTGRTNRPPPNSPAAAKRLAALNARPADGPAGRRTRSPCRIADLASRWHAATSGTPGGGRRGWGPADSAEARLNAAKERRLGLRLGRRNSCGSYAIGRGRSVDNPGLEARHKACLLLEEPTAALRARRCAPPVDRVGQLHEGRLGDIVHLPPHGGRSS